MDSVFVWTVDTVFAALFLGALVIFAVVYLAIEGLSRLGQWAARFHRRNK